MQLNKLVDRYKDYDSEKLSFELDFTTNKSIYTADLLITDWSGVAPEFCFATKRPAIFVNTKIKCENPNWQKIGLDPVEISLRNEIGVAVEKDGIDEVDKVVENLLVSSKEYKEVIENKFENLIFNHGCAAEKGARYILTSLANKKKS